MWHSHDVEDELFLVLVVLLVAIGLVLLTRHAAAATVVGLTQPTVFAAGV